MTATVVSERVGRSRGHESQASVPVDAYVLNAGELTAEIWTHGAALVRLEVPDRRGERVNVVRAGGHLLDDGVTDRRGFGGATIGRYANRIGGARFVLDGSIHRVTPNEAGNQLHGGPIGFDRYVWEATGGVDGNTAGVELTLLSPSGDQGFPGRVAATVRYVLDETTLTIDYTATTDAPTVVALTNHAYWNLSGRGLIDEHRLQLSASSYLPVDGASIPTGEFAPVEGTRFDFRRPGPIGEHLDPITARGFDHCFVLDGDPEAASLVDPRSGRTMSVTTDQPGIQVYTAEHLDPARCAVCLEAEALPDTPNRPEFGSAVLRPSGVYRQTTRHTFAWR